MDAWIKREALKAAAKVALAVTPLTACGAVIADEAPSDGTATASADELAKRRGTDAGSPDDAGAVDAAKRRDAAVAANDATTTVGDASDIDCQTLLDTLSPDGGELPSPALPSTPEVKACCSRLLTETALAWEPDGSVPTLHGHRWDCCAAVSTDPTQPWTNEFSACTPWGPPMPPKFDPTRELAFWEAA
ncbi:MAG: hypothetical protein U0235_08960 [Polyangiaceae bacterium]